MLDFSEKAEYKTVVKAKTINDAAQKALEKLIEIQNKGYRVNYIAVFPDEYVKGSYDIEIDGEK
jgi:hypothetical protein